MDYKKIFDIIDEQNEKFVDMWKDICNIESPTSCKSGVDAVCEYFVNAAKEYGFETEVQHNEISGNCACITMNPHAEGKSICISGHMDTVHPIGFFGDTPVTTDGNVIQGPGVCDCKGGTVVGFAVLAALSKSGYDKRPVKLILQSDEETGSRQSNKKTVQFMAEKAKGCAAFLNCEQYNPGKITLQRKGILRYKLTVYGKSVHSADCANGINAIAEAALKITEFEKYKDPAGITFNCGIIHGGTAENTVPEKCEFSIDIRFFNNDEKETAKKVVEKIASTEFIKGSKCEFLLLSERFAMEQTPQNLALAAKINDALTKCGLDTLEPISRCGGSDAADMTVAGIPCVDSLGVYGGRVHQRGEFAYISSLAEAAKRIAAMVLFVE